MSTAAKAGLGIAGLVVVLLVLDVPFLIVLLVLVGLPVAGYLMLDPSQRQRLRRVTRKQLGS